MTHAPSSPDWQDVSRALFETDPMNTMCQENECFDEYDRVASDVVTKIEAGAGPAQALRQSLGEWFGEDLLEDRALTPVVEQLNTQLGEGGSR